MTKRHFPESAFREVLAHPPAGVFDPRSWNYWHVAFGINPVPDLQSAGLPDASDIKVGPTAGDP